MTDLEQAIRDDLIAAGFDPEKYLGQPRLKEKRSDPNQDLYFCDKCNQGWYRWNLRYTDDGQWHCVKCAGLYVEHLEHSAWKRLQEEKSANG